MLVRTSNPGAADVEDLELAAGGTVWERVAGLVAEIGGEGPGLSDVGAVVGATAPEHIARLRELMPRAPFLLPGVGAQGGRVEDLAPAFAPGRAAGLVTASRSIVRAHEAGGAEPAAAARAEAERLRERPGRSAADAAARPILRPRMPASRRPTRWLAPLAIVAVAATGYGIAKSSGKDADDGDDPARSTSKSAVKKTTTEPAAREPTRRTYVVRAGDTLSAISLRTGVTVVRLQALNPDVDVQALQPGERLKLRR